MVFDDTQPVHRCFTLLHSYALVTKTIQMYQKVVISLVYFAESCWLMLLNSCVGSFRVKLQAQNIVFYDAIFVAKNKVLEGITEEAVWSQR